MKKRLRQSIGASALFTGVLMGISLSPSHAAIKGIAGPTFSFTAKVDHISTADGGSLQLWGYADDAGSNNGRAQYPGPTMIVNQGDTVTITLNNELPVSAGKVSMVFPGQTVTTTGGVTGVLTQEAVQDDPSSTNTDESQSVTYTFTADKPGTFTYHSGTKPELQVEMGLTGAIIVRPSGFDPNAPTAYGHPDTAYDREFLFFLSEMDPRIHETVEVDGSVPQAFLDGYVSNYFFINGRTAPDVFQEPYIGWMPTQPYNSLPRMHPGERILMRVINGGRTLHPFHHHGNHAQIIAQDGRLLESTAGAGPDLAYSVFTMPSVPGQTLDGIFQWTGKGLGWDIYGTPAAGPEFAHSCTPGPDGFDPTTHEWCADHGKEIPVVLPSQADTTFGGWWSGSPYLGTLGSLPPGEGGLNPNGGFVYMWHSHTERELTNYDIFPGGMLTMMIIESYNVPLDD
ncbi:MAG: multicopper oxidase domain-containing protein [Chromatiales bacterium]|nr:multicopper oxidase domain-containing protein [Chromatiales bacterium]